MKLFVIATLPKIVQKNVATIEDHDVFKKPNSSLDFPQSREINFQGAVDSRVAI